MNCRFCLILYLCSKTPHTISCYSPPTLSFTYLIMSKGSSFLPLYRWTSISQLLLISNVLMEHISSSANLIHWLISLKFRSNTVPNHIESINLWAVLTLLEKLERKDENSWTMSLLHIKCGLSLRTEYKRTQQGRGEGEADSDIRERERGLCSIVREDDDVSVGMT